VELLKGLQRLRIVAQTLVDQTQVVDGFNAICFNSNGLEEELLGAVEVLLDEEAIALVDQGLGVVPIMLNGQVSELFRQLEVVL
jgi:hypothetical protein